MKHQKTWGDFVNTKVDITYKKRKSKRKHVNKLLMPKGSITMGYASAALKAYQQKIYKFQYKNDDDNNNNMMEDINNNSNNNTYPIQYNNNNNIVNNNMNNSDLLMNIDENRTLINTAASSKRPWNVPPTPSSVNFEHDERLISSATSRSMSDLLHQYHPKKRMSSKRSKRIRMKQQLAATPATPTGWRRNKQLSTLKTPSLEHDLMRILTTDELLESFENEDKDFTSLALYGEIKLREAFAGTRGQGIPNVRRTAICCHLLHKLNSQFGRYQDLHMVILVELMRSIYLHFDKRIDQSKRIVEEQKMLNSPRKRANLKTVDVWSVASIIESTPFFELIDGLQAEVRKQRKSLRKLEQIRDEAELQAEKRNKVFVMAIKSWQDQIVLRAFQNWRAAQQMIKRQRSMLLRRRKIIWFKAWKKWLENVSWKKLQDEKQKIAEESKSWQESAQELQKSKAELEEEVRRLNSLIKSQQRKGNLAEAKIADLEYQLNDMSQRCKKLHGIVLNFVGNEIQQTKDRIGNIPGIKDFDESKADQLPIWCHLQDIRKLGQYAINQRNLDVYNASGGAVIEDEINSEEDEMLDIDGDGIGDISVAATTKAIKQITKKDATSLIKAWVNYHINNPCNTNMYGDSVPEEQFAQPDKSSQMRIDNFSSHLRDSQEYVLLASNILLQQPVVDRVGGYEIVVDAGEFRLPTPKTTKKKAKIAEEKAAALKAAEEEMRKSLQEIFDKMDDSSDGNLTQAELLNAINNNHEITEALSKQPRLSALLVPELWEKAFAETDTSQDGAIQFDEFLDYAYGIKAGDKLILQIYDMLDDNNDAKVSRADVLGAITGRGSAKVFSLFECHPDLKKVLDVELWEKQFEKAMDGNISGMLNQEQFLNWAKIVLKTQHEKEIAMEQSKKEKIAAEKKAKEKAVEIRLTRENFKQVVLDELDSGQRAARLLYGMRTWLGKSFPNVLLEPEEIHLSNAEWNFTALANLFVQHTSLQPDQLNFVTDYNELYDLEEKWKQIEKYDISNKETDPTPHLESLSKKIVNISNKVTDRIDELEDGHQLWWETARSVMARLVNDLCRRSRGIEGTVSESEMDRERGSFMKLSYIKVQSLFEEEDDAKYSFEAVKDFIGESFTELRKVYKAYGAMGGGSTMSMHEFLAMIRDCKLIDKSFTSQDVDLVFIKTNIEIDEITGERVEVALNPNKALTTTEFVEAIIRVSHGKYMVVTIIT